MSLALLLLCVLQAAQGLEPETVFVKRGEDLRLAGPGALSLGEAQLFWKYNRTTNILRFPSPGDPVFSQYRGRAELIEESYSLLVKRVNHSDSGVYTAVVSGDRDRDVAQYRVQVLDPVSPVPLKVVTTSLSEDTCDLTVTCGPINSSFTYNCKTRREDGGPQVNHTGSTYRIYHENSNIICNHNNQVSGANDTKVVSDLCAPVCRGPAPSVPMWLLIFIILLVVGGLTLGIVLYKRRKNTRGEQRSEVPNPPAVQDTSPRNHGEPESGPMLDSTYALVDFHTGPSAAPPPDAPSPETLYAQVDKLRPREGDSALHRL